jgi:hypothetical protein
MRRVRGETPTGSTGYEVGYGRPPLHSRFRPGQSGNPAGRHKGVRNLGTDVRRTLKVLIKVKHGDQSRKISTQEGLLMVLREKALKGDSRALDRLLELAGRFNNEPAETELQALSADDSSILSAYAAEISRASTSASAQPPKQPRIKLRRQRDKGSSE